MKEIRFKHLSIDDFQGISHFEFDFNTNTTRLLGTNASGKSSVVDAILWIITGKNQKDQSDSNFEIVPLDKEGRMISTSEPHGELVIEVDGVERIIARKLKLKVPKTKGGEIDYSSRFKTERTFWLDGLNYKATQFNTEIKNIFGDNETFKILSNVIHFGKNKSEKAQRDLLLSYIKPVSHEMICEIDEKFKTLTDLEKLPFENVLEQTRAKIIEHKKEIEATKNRISEVEFALSEFKDVDVSKFGDLEVERSKIQNELSALKKKVQEQNIKQEQKLKLEKDLMTVEYDIENFNTKFQNRKEMDVESLERKIRFKQNDIDKCVEIRNGLVAEFQALNVKITNAEIEVDEIIAAKLEELKSNTTRRINAETKYYDDIIAKYKTSIVAKKNEKVEDMCSQCEQLLPIEKVSEIETYIQNAINGFEQHITDMEKGKETKLLEINDLHKQEVKALNDSKEEMVTSRASSYRSQIKQINVKGAKNNENKGLYEVELTKLREELSQLASEQPNQAKKDILYSKKEGIELEIKELIGTENVSYTDVDSKQIELDVLNNKLNNKDTITNNKNRKVDLKKSQTEKIKGLSELEDKKSLLEDYLQVKNDLLSKELRLHFNKDITFKFIEFTQDGTPKDVFKLLINGVPYSNANTAGKILAGIQMINFFQSKLGVQLPILIDNREAVVVELPQTDSQIFECVATNKYKKLKIEEEK